MIIYKVTNQVNGKIYIGQTTTSMNERRGDHRRKAQKHRSRSHFHAAIRYHGFGSFCWEIIDYADSRDELNDKERRHITCLDSTNPTIGYNLTSGGDSPEFTDEVKKKIGLAGVGRKKSDEEVKAIKERTAGSNNPFFGKSHDQASRIKCGAKNVGRKLSPEHIAKCVHRGENNHRSKITVADVIRIKELQSMGKRQVDIIKETGIGKDIVSPIRRGLSWRHVTI